MGLPDFHAADWLNPPRFTPVLADGGAFTLIMVEYAAGGAGGSAAGIHPAADHRAALTCRTVTGVGMTTNTLGVSNHAALRVGMAGILPAGGMARISKTAGACRILHMHVTDRWLHDEAVQGARLGTRHMPRADQMLTDPALRGLALLLEAQLAQAGRELLFLQQWALVAGRRIFAGPAQGSGTARLAPWRIRRVLERIEAGMDQLLTLPALAAEAGVSQFHFLRAFRQETGLTPQRYVDERRAQRALALLRQGLAPDEIMRRCGYATRRQMDASLRRQSGLSSREWLRWRGHAPLPVSEGITSS